MNDSPRPAAGRLLRVAALFYLVLAIAGVLGLGWNRAGPLPLELFAVPRQAPLDLGLGVAAGLLLVGLWEIGRRRLVSAAELEGRLSALLAGLRAEEAIALALLSAVAEETLFRGAVQGAFGWLPATVLFALLHTGPQRALRLWGLFALAAGALFGALVLWRGPLLPAVTAHFVVNSLNLLRLSRPQRISGKA